MGIELAQAQPQTGTQLPAQYPGSAQEQGGGISREMLKPLLAGARARGLCDAFDMLGLAAILFDRTGMALQANATAKTLMGADLAIAHRHLVGRDAGQTRAMQALIGQAISGRAKTADLQIRRTDVQGSYRLEALAMGGGDDPGQLVQAIILIRA